MFAKYHALVTVLLFGRAGTAFAGPDIDVVYGDDIAPRGELAGQLRLAGRNAPVQAIWAAAAYGKPRTSWGTA